MPTYAPRKTGHGPTKMTGNTIIFLVYDETAMTGVSGDKGRSKVWVCAEDAFET